MTQPTTVAELLAELAVLADPVVAGAGWALTVERVAERPDGLDLPGLLDVIEAEMRDAPHRLPWAMNHCLARIGIEHAGLRARRSPSASTCGCSRTTRRHPAAHRPTRRSGSPRWCAGSTPAEPPRTVACGAPGSLVGNSSADPRTRSRP